MEILRAPFLISSSNLNIFAPQTRYNMELNEHNKAEYPPMHTDKPDTPYTLLMHYNIDL